MPTPVTSDTLLQARAEELRTLLNSGHLLRLFSNDLTPAPDTPRSAYVEATFGGYEAKPLAGQWSSVVMAQPGLWEFQAGPFEWARDGGSGGTVYGWYIDGGDDVPFAQRFANPVSMEPKTILRLLVTPQDWSVSLLK